MHCIFVLILSCPLFIFSFVMPSPQGELVNQIEFNVEHTANYVQRATQLTGEARQYKSKNRRVSDTAELSATYHLGLVHNMTLAPA